MPEIAQPLVADELGSPIHSLFETALRIAEKITDSRTGARTVRVKNAHFVAELADFLFRLRENFTVDGFDLASRVESDLIRTLAEELRFFFECPALAIYRGVSSCVYKSFTDREFELVEPAIEASIASFSASEFHKSFPLSVTEEQLRERAANDNFQDCKTLVILKHNGAEATWYVCMWLTSTLSDSPLDQKHKTLLNEEAAAELLPSLFHTLPALETARGASAPSPNVPLLPTLDLPRDVTTVDAFCRQARELFLPLDSILEPLRLRILSDLCHLLKTTKSEVSCLFSVKPAGDRTIHFYVTADQMEGLLSKPEDIGALVDLCSFRYLPGDALSGWVLETGCSLYLEDFGQSNLWRQFIEQSDTTRKQANIRQLARVKQFFKVEDAKLKHAYLLPLLLHTEPDGSIVIDLMLSITTKQPIPTVARRRIYEMLRRLASAVRVSLEAQRQYERAVAASRLQPFLRFFDHELRGRAQALAGLIAVGTTIDAATHAACNAIIEDIKGVCEVASAFHDLVREGRKLTKESVTDLRTTVEAIWDRSWQYLVGRRSGYEALKARSGTPAFKQTTLPTVQLHEHSFYFLLRNLIVNAAQAVDANADGRVEMSVEALGVEAVRVIVRDNGPGMTLETKTRLRTRQRVSVIPGTNTLKDPPSGFGWEFIRLCCEAHGATVEFGDPARGCEVVLTIPVNAA